MLARTRPELKLAKIDYLEALKLWVEIQERERVERAKEDAFRGGSDAIILKKFINSSSFATWIQFPGMLSKSLASPLHTFKSAASCSFHFSDLSSSTPKFPLVKKNRAYESSWANNRSWRPLNLHHASKKQNLLAVDQAQLVILEDEEKKTWEDCIKIISAFGFTIEEADLILKKAFGWIHSPYWGEERSKELPEVQSINAVLDYLKSLGVSDDDLHKLLKKFPEVLGCDFDDEIKINVSTLEREWGIKGKPLRNLLLRNPKVLGYNVDCKGDCMAKCTRCWVRF
ncbi:hypothetical protein J5N97_022387 [Dioscorea zingiberensis]|uniref:Mitochondrial transcription termination factor family protein n=1 Tax=Dioscorea zingiberensis TaxID=325984 RepID=A0A9D5HAU3_9LILI|nr:hypothetical protein J5N97_022387 [Dioscorea zingiberensis]